MSIRRIREFPARYPIERRVSEIVQSKRPYTVVTLKAGSPRRVLDLVFDVTATDARYIDYPSLRSTFKVDVLDSYKEKMERAKPKVVKVLLFFVSLVPRDGDKLLSLAKELRTRRSSSSASGLESIYLYIPVSGTLSPYHIPQDLVDTLYNYSGATQENIQRIKLAAERLIKSAGIPKWISADPVEGPWVSEKAVMNEMMKKLFSRLVHVSMATRRMGHEHSFTVCVSPQGTYASPPVAGNPTNIRPLRCRTEEIVVGDLHTHPGLFSPLPSSADLGYTGYHGGGFFCVLSTESDSVGCYFVPPGKAERAKLSRGSLPPYPGAVSIIDFGDMRREPPE